MQNLAIFFFVLFSPALIKADNDSETVVTLTASNFDGFVQSNPHVLVKFYAPWCHYCKELAPKYEEAAKKIRDDNIPVVLAKLDCTVERSVADTYEIRGYPTLLFFRNTEPEKFTGGRTTDEIVDWLKSMSGEAVLELAEKEFEEHLKKNSVVFVAHTGPDGQGLAHLDIFHKIAEKNRQKGSFVKLKSDVKPTSIHVYRLDETPIEFTGTDEDSLSSFVTDESFPLFGPINGENFMAYSERPHELVWFCGTKADNEKAKTGIREAAMKHRDSLSFVWLDTEDYANHATEALGVSEFPALVYQSKNGRYLLQDKEGINSGPTVLQFFQDVKDGKIAKSLKSQEEPAENNELVKVVVGKSFESIVFSEDKDVMLEVYAPWCKHCKDLAPKYEELAVALKNVSHVTIAKMDGTLNESPTDSFDWTGFPSLFFVKAGAKTPMKYEGARTVEALLKYIKDNSSKTISDDVITTPPSAPPSTPPAGGTETGATPEEGHDEL